MAGKIGGRPFAPFGLVTGSTLHAVPLKPSIASGRGSVSGLFVARLNIAPIVGSEIGATTMTHARTFIAEVSNSPGLA